MLLHANTEVGDVTDTADSTALPDITYLASKKTVTYEVFFLKKIYLTKGISSISKLTKREFSSL